jgi:hypothetical protein
MISTAGRNQQRGDVDQHSFDRAAASADPVDVEWLAHEERDRSGGPSARVPELCSDTNQELQAARGVMSRLRLRGKR